MTGVLRDSVTAEDRLTGIATTCLAGGVLQRAAGDGASRVGWLGCARKARPDGG